MVETPNFQRVANKRDLKEGGLLGVQINGNRVVLSMVEGKIYAMNAVCSHKGAPLEQGTLMGYDLKCPWHLRFLTYVTEKYRRKQCGQKIWNLIPYRSTRPPEIF